MSKIILRLLATGAFLLTSVGISIAQDRLFHLVPNNSTIAPTSADANGSNQGATTITATTRASGSGIDSAPYTASYSYTGQVVNQARYSAQSASFETKTFVRYSADSLYAIAAWDFDFSQIKSSHFNIELNLDAAVSSSLGEAEFFIFVSYTDSSDGITYDGLATSAMGTGSQIKSRLLSVDKYRQVDQFFIPVGEAGVIALSAFDLQRFIDRMDSGSSSLRVVIAGHSYRRNLTLYRDASDSGSAGIGSYISGTPKYSGFSNNSHIYEDFLQDKAAGIETELPDFSYAGRGSAAQEPPAVSTSTHTYFDVTNYGAYPDDNVSDRAAIVAAIAAAEAHSGPAVVYFPAGRFIARGEDDFGEGPIVISRSDIVLKGAGMYSNGTEIYAKSPTYQEYVFEVAPNIASVSFRGKRTLTTFSQVPVRGSLTVEVNDTSLLNVGDVVRIAGALPDNYEGFKQYFAPNVHDGDIQGFCDNASCGGANYRSDFHSTHEIAAINSNTVTFKEPIQVDYSLASTTVAGGVKLVQIFEDGDEMLKDVGIEDLALVADYRDQFKHYANRTADSYNLVVLKNIRESWIRRVRTVNGTRGLYFAENGKNNVIYDILVEGNSGHYSLTTAGNYYGNQHSFIREQSPNQHGLGATNSAFSTVYHRCNQFGAPEAHGGYPQASLYDLNEGDLTIGRVGGAPPHHGRYMVFWNWKQDWMVPTNSRIKDVNNSKFSASSIMSGKLLDVWPAYYVLPFLVGAHGASLDVSDPFKDFQVLEYEGQKVAEESLFEAQLAERFGSVPGWIASRAGSFEATTRYSQVDISSPLNDANFLEGQNVSVTRRYHDNFDLGKFKKLELLAGRGHDLDFIETPVNSTTNAGTASLSWTPGAGQWRLRLRLTNTLDEESYSDPVYIMIRPSSNPNQTNHNISDAWLQPRSMGTRGIFQASDSVVYTNLNAYHSSVRAIEKPLVQSSVDDPSNKVVGDQLIDGNLNTNATNAAAFQYHGRKGLVFDLGISKRVDYIRLYGPTGSDNIDLLGLFHIQVSDRPESEYSYTNSDLSWRTVRRFGHARTANAVRLGSGRYVDIYLPAGTTGRYLRIFAESLDSTDSNAGNLSEVQIGYYAGLDTLQDSITQDLIRHIPTAGMQIRLKGNNNKYVAYDVNNKLFCNAVSPTAEGLFTVVDAGDGRLGLQPNNGKFISSENGSQDGMSSFRPGLGSWERFVMKNEGDGKISLRAIVNNKYVSSENGGRSMRCNRNSVAAWELFTWIEE